MMTEKQWLTTGQAAKLCSVERDTVLKWIKRGQVQVARTAGGHYRIDWRNLQEFLPENRCGIRSSSPGIVPRHRPLRCWEYLSARGQMQDECKDCVAFEVGASRCFRLRGIAVDSGKSFCTGPESCEDCSYYRRVMNLPVRVLIVSTESDLLRRLTKEAGNKLEILVAQNGYEASGALSRFQPGYIIVDTETQDGPASALVQNLARDNRLHGPRVILATAPSALNRRLVLEKHEIVVAKLAKPIEASRLLALIERTPVEHLV